MSWLMVRSVEDQQYPKAAIQLNSGGRGGYEIQLPKRLEAKPRKAHF